MKTKLFLLLAIFCFLIGCEKEGKEQTFNNPEELLGAWSDSQINGDVWVFRKVDKLKDNDYGFIFKSEQKFIERKNSGWCGTPPIVYSDFEGTWNRKKSIINITVQYWGGTVDYQWEIISMNKDVLKIHKTNETYHKRY